MTDYSQQTGKGIAYGVAAYITWGINIFYFKWVAHVSAPEVLAHRIIWSVFFLAVVLLLKKQIAPTIQACRDKKTLLFLAGSTILIAANWLQFIWAIANNRILDTSLGYFINPLLNIVLGFVFLRERFRKMQILCVALAFIGVAFQTYSHGHVPMLSLGIAFTFGFYGLLRKQTPLASIPGLAAETVLLFPFALGYLFYLNTQNSLVFLHLDLRTDLLLPLAGFITSLPLIWFANAAKRLRYSTIGFLTYISPSLTFIFAVTIYHEPLGTARFISFIFIWTALIIYSIDMYFHEKKSRRVSN
ncbi:MAG: EamA family transporter RarD [Candidatus Zixiibacteriota bacterium]